jgi:LuxR family maltose regulon positive regulatory protein
LLRQRAAIWYAENRLPDRAVRHAIAAGDLDLAARVISENYLHLLELGRTATLMAWLDEMPPDAIEADRRLGVVKAWTMHFLGRHEEGNAALALAITAPAAAGPQPDGASSIDSTAALLGAAFPGDDAGRMLGAARRAFEYEAARESPWRTTVHVLLGFALARCGRWEEAREPLQLGAELAMASEMWMDAVGARSLLGLVELETGDPATAEHFARAAIDLADAHGLGPTATYAYGRAILGRILVQRGNADAANVELSEALPVMRALGEPLGLAETLLPLSQARRTLGRREEASLLLREASSIIDAMRDPGVLREARRTVASGRTGRSSDQVSQRELEVLQAMAGGASKREAADKLFVSYNTVHSHVRSIYQKLDAHSLPEAVAKARRLGLIE